MIFITPSGMPASYINSASRRELRGVCSAGFSTWVHPVARTGPILNILKSNGKFHGTMVPTTPTGSFLVYPKC